MPAFFYILRCSDGTYYVGHASDPHVRLEVHNAGRGPQYTRARLPVELIHSERFAAVQDAVGREAQVKRWSAQKKRALAEGATDTLKTLAQRRQR
jgi:predicted GIY-YIG superfamily endonuclease